MSSEQLTNQQLLEHQQHLENLNFEGELPDSDDVPPADPQPSLPPVAEPRTPPSGGHIEDKGFDPPNVHRPVATPPPPPTPSPTPSVTPAPNPSVTPVATPSSGAASIAPSTTTNMSSTIGRIQRVVDNHLDLLAEGRISELPPHVVTLMNRLVSLQEANRAAERVSHRVLSVDASSHTPSVPDLTRSFAAALSQQKHVVLGPTDVKQIPRLDGKSKVDVTSVLSQFRLIASFKVTGTNPTNISVTELEKRADAVAFESFSLVCDGPVLQMYQEMMSGKIDCSSAAVSHGTVEQARSYPPPATCVEPKTALLHRLMPSNIVEESALSLVNLGQAGNENVSSCALQPDCTRFEQAVERITPGRSPYQALLVTLFQNGLFPNVRSKVLDKKTVIARRDAIDRARRTESANLSGEPPAVSAVSLNPVTSRARLSQKFDTARQNRGRTQSFRSAPTSGGGPSTNGRRTPRNGNNRGGGNSSRSTSRERPRCSHPSCKKPLGNTTDTCFQSKREEAQAAKNRRENNRPVAKRWCAEDRTPRKDQNNDDSDA